MGNSQKEKEQQIEQNSVKDELIENYTKPDKLIKRVLVYT